jgi:hypothetical protein
MGGSLVRRGSGAFLGMLVACCTVAGAGRAAAEPDRHPGAGMDAHPLPAAGSAAPGGAAGGTAGPQAVAARAARASGRPVQIAALATATSTVFALPDGALRAVFTAVPTRVRRGAGWVPLDTTLTRGAAGGVVPVAVPRPLVLSGGGSGPLVRFGSGSARLDVRWPGPLPRPVLRGPAARYPGVLPGVDLRVAATETGFSLLLVVRDRAAARRLLAAPPAVLVSSPDLRVRADGAGGVVASDRAGHPVFAAPPAAMWDASGGPGAGSGRVRRVRLTLAGAVLRLGLDPAMVADPATRYPLSVDPSFSATTLNWTDVLQQSPGVSFWNGQNLIDPSDPNGPIMVGHDPTYGTAARALFQLNTSSVNGKHILGATFRITEKWAYSCTASTVELWLTGGISSSTTWNNQPSWTTRQSSVSAAKKNGQSGSCGPGQLSFNATDAAVKTAANRWPNLTLGLKAASEGDATSWKRFAKDASLQIDYNSVPTVGTRSTSPATGCVTSGSAPAANDPLVNNPNPTLLAFANDADSAETDLRGNFGWQSWNGTAWVSAGSGADPIARGANTQTSLKIGTALLDATVYRWQVRIADPVMSPYTGTDYSAWSSWCEFRTDFSVPPAATVDATVYSAGCSACGGVGTPDTFTLTGNAADVVGYYYGFADPPAVRLNPAAAGGSVSFGWTPPSGGPYTLYVQTIDGAGNRSAITRYPFGVAAPAPALARWLLEDPPGSTDLIDATGNGNTATLSDGTLGAPGRITGRGALLLDGAAGYASAAPLLDTARSFTVSAWVRLGDTTASRVALGQAGDSETAFWLGYDQARDRWAFTGLAADAPGTAAIFGPASAAAPVPGVWTHLAGVYDAPTRQASLYVNGVLAQAQTATGPAWTAGGPLLIGRGQSGGNPGGFWAGSVADVQVWQRTRYPAEIAAQLDPTSTGLVAANSFASTGGAGTVEISAPDPLGVTHDLMLAGTATVPPSGAGYQGTGLALDGAGYADSSIDDTPQVLHTDQPFTVSAWVYLSGASLPAAAMTAVSQQGVNTSGFFLGYRIVGGTGRWAFSLPGTDAAGSTGWTDATSTAALAPVPRRWTQLAGVFDPGARTASLYVNGQLAATVPRAAAWDATGPLVAGAALVAGTAGSALAENWIGDIDEVRGYQALRVAPAGSWQFTGCTGTPPACPDTGTGNHPLTLASSGASLTDTGLPSNQTGPVLTVNGSTGYAATAAPVVRTDQSFTVGAWVRVGTLPTSGVHVIAAQSGTSGDFFELRYDADRRQLCFTALDQDGTAAAATSSCGPDLAAGQWTFVAGSYDVVAGTLTLCTAVPGGTPVGAPTAAFTSPWYATGSNAALRVGAGLRAGTRANFLTADITGVQVYPGVVADPGALM